MKPNYPTGLAHIVLAGVVLLAGSIRAGGAAPQEAYPVFSWDTVPLYLHFASGTLLSDADLETVARLCNFVALEKTHGRDSVGAAEKGIAIDAAKLRQLNPRLKVLFYWNTFLAYPFTTYTKDFEKEHPDWVFRDRQGKPLYKIRNLAQYNLLNPDFRAWWASVAGDAVRQHGCDGIFMDAIDQSKRPVWMTKGWGEGAESKLTDAAIDMIQRARATMGPNSLIIYNGFRTNEDELSTRGFDYLDYADGGMFEHFDQFKSATKECILSDWEIIKRASEKGKITIVKAWPDHNFNYLNTDLMSQSYDELERMARERIIYPLACFLIGAQERSYLCYSWGYRSDQGSLIDYPEYHKPLGRPKGEARRGNANGWEFTREFEHASVWVDLEKRKATIDWEK